MVVQQERSEHRAKLALPSLVTAVRIALLVPFVEVLRSGRHPVLAAVILAVIGFSDFLDGYLARHFHAVTTFGKVFDPVSDRVVLATVALTLYFSHVVPLILIAAIVIREALVSVIATARYLMGHVRTEVVFIGKAGTFTLLAGFPLAVWATAHGFPTVAREAIDGLLILGTFVLYVALISYARSFLSQLHAHDGAATV